MELDKTNHIDEGHIKDKNQHFFDRTQVLMAHNPEERYEIPFCFARMFFNDVELHNFVIFKDDLNVGVK